MNKLNIIVLTFAAAMGSVRSILREASARQLETLGFRWSSSDPLQNAIGIVIGSNPSESTRLNLTRVQSEGEIENLLRLNPEAVEYDAVTEFDRFLRAAMDYKQIADEMPIERVIEGVRCSIDRNGVVADLTGLVGRVEQEAHRIRLQHFRV